MFLGFLVSAIPLALRFYLNIYAFNRDSKTLLNYIFLIIICTSSVYFFFGVFLAGTFFYDQAYLSGYAIYMGLCSLFLDSLFSIIQVVRVFVFKFGIRVRIYRCLSLAMIFLTANAGVAMIFALGARS
nr:hypothetical protein [uncultured Roseibium sp.]